MLRSDSGLAETDAGVAEAIPFARIRHPDMIEDVTREDQRE
jgi:hypothetical protein